MDVVLLILIALLLGVASTTLYLNLKSKQKKDENKEAEEITNLKSEISSLKDTLNSTINTSLGAMSTSFNNLSTGCLLYTSPSPRDVEESRMPSSA